MHRWLILIASIPGASKTPRMRIWRSLRACGAEALRDGVYLLPAADSSRRAFDVQVREITGAGGSAFVLPVAAVSGKEQKAFEVRFDRRAEYERLVHALERFGRAVNRSREADARRRLARLRRELAALQRIDFFGGSARVKAESALAHADAAINAAFSADEPRSVKMGIERRDKRRYRGRLWATRRHLWIDRVCSAWLIRRFIDPRARFLWLTDASRCPAEALGFDFDGATFTHVTGRVTFEVLAASFGLERNVGIARLGALVRYLDVGGGIPVAEAAGLETIMAGIRASRVRDDEILEAMSGALDGLYAAYSDTEART
jgi:hypothetical protein